MLSTVKLRFILNDFNMEARLLVYELVMSNTDTVTRERRTSSWCFISPAVTFFNVNGDPGV